MMIAIAHGLILPILVSTSTGIYRRPSLTLDNRNNPNDEPQQIPSQSPAARSRSWCAQVVSWTQKRHHRFLQLTETREDAMGLLHKQERALRAIEAVAVSGFAVDSQSLKASCLTICNTYRECVPLGLLRIDRDVPSPLLAVIWPDPRQAEDHGASRVLRPRQVLKVNWEFDDPTPTHTVESEGGGVEEKEDENGHDENGEQEQNNEEGNKEEGKARTTHKEEEAEEEEEEEEKEDKEDERLIKDKDSDEEEVERGQVTAFNNIDMSKVLWPKGVKGISLGRFNRPVDGVAWPDCLEVLSFHMPSRLFWWSDYEDRQRGVFNSPLDEVVFPAGLREIFLGFNFNLCIEGVAWPEGLERLSMPGFNHSIQSVQWPSGLKTLEFITPYQFEIRESSDKVPWTVTYGGFDQPLGTFLPMSLETLWLSDGFDQSLRGVTWPNGLAVLGIGAHISHESMDGPKSAKVGVGERHGVPSECPPRL